MSSIRESWDDLFSLKAYAGAIDPNDHRGFKNRYVAMLRDFYIRTWFFKHFGERENTTLLDIGCGTGASSQGLLHAGACVIGADISINGLQLADRSEFFLPVQVDGHNLPIQENSLDGAITYASLLYILEDDLLIDLLEQLHRACKPGAQLMFIEQCSSSTRVISKQHKKLRTPEHWQRVLQEAGFSISDCALMRNGHGLHLYLLRYGIVKNISLRLAKVLESMSFRLTHWHRSEYFEQRFYFSKPI